MSEGIFNLVPSSKKLTKPLNFLLLLEKLRNVDLVKFLRIPSEIIPFLKATVQWTTILLFLHIYILFFQYLGQGQEVAGRTILDEDLIQDLPIIARPGIILMPGQTLPMNFFHPTVMSVMKNLISGSKTFGVVHSRCVDSTIDNFIK